MYVFLTHITHTHTYVHIQAKHLQFLSGAEVSSFWLANLTWDFLLLLLPLALSVAIVAAFQAEAFSGIALLAVACLLVCKKQKIMR